MFTEQMVGYRVQAGDLSVTSILTSWSGAKMERLHNTDSQYLPVQELKMCNTRYMFCTSCGKHTFLAREMWVCRLLSTYSTTTGNSVTEALWWTRFYGRECGLLKFKIYAGVQGKNPPPQVPICLNPAQYLAKNKVFCCKFVTIHTKPVSSKPFT